MKKKIPAGSGSSPGCGSTRWYLGLREGKRGNDAALSPDNSENKASLTS